MNFLTPSHNHETLCALGHGNHRKRSSLKIKARSKNHQHHRVTNTVQHLCIKDAVINCYQNRIFVIKYLRTQIKALLVIAWSGWYGGPLSLVHFHNVVDVFRVTLA